MHKIIILLSLFLFVSSAFAQGERVSYDFDETNYRQNNDDSKNDKWDSDETDYFYTDLIEPYYGSDQSPAFLNRENINPNESDYGYGSTDGTY